MKIVQNEQPKFFNQPYRIAFIGEAPGATEDEVGRPFMGPSGNLLWSIASKYGIVREACFVGNVCQVKPPNNKIELFSFHGPEITDGIRQLASDLATFRPNLCVLLGNTALRALTGETGISAWRGSLLRGTGLGTNHAYKCLPALHPTSILREYSGLPLLHFDLKRARLEGERPDLNLPQRQLDVDLTIGEMCDRMDDIILRKPIVSIDLEGYWNNMWCISIAESPSKCFLVEFNNHQDLADECLLWRRLALILQDPAIGKIAQNAAYELFVMQYGHSIPIRNVVDDTMLAHWELYCELDKNLGLQASIYTREPHWKDEREDDDPTTRKIYCCKDSAVTYEIRDVLRPRLTGDMGAHYEFNLALLDPIIYMECKGLNYDQTKANQKTSTCTLLQHRLQATLDSIAGIPVPSDIAGWVNVSREVHCFKKSSSFVNLVSDLVPHSKLTELHRTKRVAEVLHGDLSLAAKGELSALTDLSLNVESKNQMADFLYRQLGLPVQYKKEGGRLTTKETTDVLALLTLYKKTQDPTLKLVLTIRSLRTRLDTLAAATDPDARIRCGYNVVGTDTGRLSCYEAPTGSGFNLQTVSKKDRDLFLPDEGYWFFQCDLSGADGWTVAAHCYACGDPTMLEDYRFGLKPARIIALLYQFGGSVLRWSRDELKAKGKLVDSDGWLYFASKRVQHGSNYGMGENTMSDQILKDSYKLFGEPIYVAPAVCYQLRLFYFSRYPGIARWHDRCKQKLLKDGCLTSANGHRRVFWGRKKEPSGKINHQTFYSFLSDEPQNNTTYATNLALHKLWTDPENLLNREATEGLPTAQRFDRLQPRRIQPLHQVHDALIGQFPKGEVMASVARIKTYFNNTLVIAGVPIVIPFEGAYGRSWGELTEGVI